MIRTAEEFLKEYELGNTGKIDIEDAKEAIIEFAKLHVEAALKAASENATTVNKPKFKGDINYVVDEDSILNAYPIEHLYTIIPEEPKDVVLGYKTSLDAQMLDRLETKQETLEEASEIDLTNLCYYDKRNPDCSADDEDIEDHKKSLLKKNKTCSCDNCFYGLTKLTEQLIRQQETMYSEEDIIEFAEFVTRYPDKNKNHIGQMLHAKSRYDVAERTLDLLQSWFEEFKKK